MESTRVYIFLWKVVIIDKKRGCTLIVFVFFYIESLVHTYILSDGISMRQDNLNTLICRTRRYIWIPLVCHYLCPSKHKILCKGLSCLERLTTKASETATEWTVTIYVFPRKGGTNLCIIGSNDGSRPHRTKIQISTSYVSFLLLLLEVFSFFVVHQSGTRWTQSRFVALILSP